MVYRRVKIDWSNLEQDYRRLGSCRAVAKEYGVHYETVRYRMIQQGLDRKCNLLKTGGNSQFGRECELFVFSLLPGAEDYAATDPQAPFDIKWADKRIEVIRSNLADASKKKGKRWMFSIKRNITETSDYVSCVGYEGDLPQFVLLIPSNKVPKTGITVYKDYYDTSKYRQYQFWHRSD